MDAKLKPFIKTINPEDLPAEAWNIVLGRKDESDLQELYQQVSWLFRGVDIRCNGVASMPFGIFNGKTEVDSSDDYQNVVGFLPNPGALAGLVEMALTIWGIAYLYKRPNIIKTKLYSLRYLPPPTVQLRKTDKGTLMLDRQDRPIFTREEAGEKKDYSADQIVYFWNADPFVEFGPPLSSPARAAALSAGVVLNTNLFASSFLLRGAIKPFLLTIEGPTKPAELEKLKDFLARIFRPQKKKEWPTEVINAQKITPVMIGEGLEAVAGKENQLTTSKREEIATALGIPHSILFSGAANYAVSDKDDFHLYDKTIVPECNFIEQVLNEQVFAGTEYHLKYKPQTLDIFQEDEEQRAQSLSFFMDAIAKADTLDLAQAAFDIFGYEISSAAMSKLEAHYAAKEERRQEFAANIQPTGAKPQLPPQNSNEAKQELNKWLSKIKNRWNPKTKSAAEIDFDSEVIPPGLHGAILGMLEGAKSLSDVEQVFEYASEWGGYP